ncbi:TRIM56 [Branchiostoma lanceolatum]|uniref:TRIM56 protein n=2 Tax=Branchiostoma lanceolatum TaxID=7740 RepID=A0A8J9ZCV0_BRALA|nr:TRIM56 [Branchiostoma lanceolatum]
MASNDLSEEIQEDILSCPICYHQLREPKALPCQHTYCCDCLQELARRANNGQFNCPECGKAITIPAQGVQAFPTNFLVANVLQKVQQCKEEKQKQADETDMCDVHRQEAQVVCDTCTILVCTACLKSGHKGHTLKHIDQEKAIKVDEVKKLIAKSGEVSAGLSLQESHTLVKQRLQEKHDEIAKQIESRASAAIHTLLRQKKSLLEELGQRRERKLEKIGQRETRCNRLIETMLEGRNQAEEAINSNTPLLYKDISSHCHSLSAAILDGITYRSKYSPLQEEVCGLKFEPSLVELGHFVEGSVEVSPRGGLQTSPRHNVQRILSSISVAKSHDNKKELNPGKKGHFGSTCVTAAAGSASVNNGTLIILDDDDDTLSSSHTPTDQQEPAARKRKTSPKSHIRYLSTEPQASSSHASDLPAIPKESNAATPSATQATMTAQKFLSRIAFPIALPSGDSNGDSSDQTTTHRLTSLVSELQERLDSATKDNNGDNSAEMAARENLLENLASDLQGRLDTTAAMGDNNGDNTARMAAQESTSLASELRGRQDTTAATGDNNGDNTAEMAARENTSLASDPQGRLDTTAATGDNNGHNIAEMAARENTSLASELRGRQDTTAATGDSNGDSTAEMAG